MNSLMPDAFKWEFWIDVGGTFTDCIAGGRRARYGDTNFLAELELSMLSQRRRRLTREPR